MAFGGEVSQLSQIIHEGRQQSFTRMVQEARERGGVGITGVTSELRHFHGNIEFLSVASTIHAADEGKPSGLFSTSGDGQELYCQLDANYIPLQFVRGLFGRAMATMVAVLLTYRRNRRAAASALRRRRRPKSVAYKNPNKNPENKCREAGCEKPCENLPQTISRRTFGLRMQKCLLRRAASIREERTPISGGGEVAMSSTLAENFDSRTSKVQSNCSPFTAAQTQASAVMPGSSNGCRRLARKHRDKSAPVRRVFEF